MLPMITSSNGSLFFGRKVLEVRLCLFFDKSDSKDCWYVCVLNWKRIRATIG